MDYQSTVSPAVPTVNDSVKDAAGALSRAERYVTILACELAGTPGTPDVNHPPAAGLCESTFRLAGRANELANNLEMIVNMTLGAAALQADQGRQGGGALRPR